MIDLTNFYFYLLFFLIFLLFYFRRLRVRVSVISHVTVTICYTLVTITQSYIIRENGRMFWKK